MKCDQCQVNEATVHIQQNINGTESERHLCADCARRGYEQGQQALQDLAGSFFSQPIPAGVFHALGGVPSFGTAASPTAPAHACPACGTTYDMFRKTGLVGCASCYDTFGERMEQIFARVQASGHHTGRVYEGAPAAAGAAGDAATPAAPTVTDEARPAQVAAPDLATQLLTQLRGQLRAAITREDYEEAARLRDEIRAHEARITSSERGEEA